MRTTTNVNRFSNRIAGWFPAAGVLAFTSLMAGPLAAQTVQRPSAVQTLTKAVSFAATQSGRSPNSAAPDPNSNQYGELSAVWWQWIYSIPGATNPNFTQGVVDCSYKIGRASC